MCSRYLHETVCRAPLPGIGVFVILTLGVGLGLLLLSVMASTSLSEERTRGSLDVLLATPLPTASIVWGKWWGAFRIVPLLAFWPTVVIGVHPWSHSTSNACLKTTAPMAVPSSSTTGLETFLVVQMAMIVLVHGAAITSLGLAVATWIPRPGRAVRPFRVAAYVLVSVGWTDPDSHPDRTRTGGRRAPG